MKPGRDKSRPALYLAACPPIEAANQRRVHRSVCGTQHSASQSEVRPGYPRPALYLAACPPIEAANLTRYVRCPTSEVEYRPGQVPTGPLPYCCLPPGYSSNFVRCVLGVEAEHLVTGGQAGSRSPAGTSPDRPSTIAACPPVIAANS